VGSLLVEKFKKFWEWCGHIDLAWSLFNVGSGVLVGSVMTFISWFGEMPAPFIVFSGLLALVGGFILANQWEWRKQQRANKIGYAIAKTGKKKSLAIEFFQDHAFSVGPHEGHDVKRGPWFTAQITIANNGLNPLHNVKVSIMSIKDFDEKFPVHLQGKLSLPFPLLFSESQDGPIELNPSERIVFSVFHFHQTFWNPYINLGTKQGPGINSGPYVVEIQATSQEEYSESLEFIVGLFRNPEGGSSTPYFESTIMPNISLEQKRMLLFTLRGEGVQLRDERLPTVAMFDVWNDKYEIWHLRVLRTANSLDPELKHQLRPLNTWKIWGLGHPVNTQHETALEIISETLARIESYLGIPSGSH